MINMYHDQNHKCRSEVANNKNPVTDIETLSWENTQLTILWSNGFEATFHPLWLRESSTHPDYTDPGTKMRIPQASQLPLDIGLKRVDVHDNNQTISINFTDGHQSVYDLNELYKSALKLRPDDLAGEKLYWDSSFEDYKTFDYQILKNSQVEILDILTTVAKTGFAYVSGLPVEENALKQFANLIGPIRETNWGTVTDVRNMPNPYDLTVTARSLSPHVDNPYRLPAPGYIVMHCLRNDATGGESIMIDGFKAALMLKQSDLTTFTHLSSICPNFRHCEDSAILEDYGPIIQTNDSGEIIRIRFSNRTEQVPPLNLKMLDQYYHARKAFAQIVFSNQMALTIKLKPGDGFIWDNYRILHGRNAFDVNTGDRHMRHCYLDRDTFSSRQKCLIRDLAETYE